MQEGEVSLDSLKEALLENNFSGVFILSSEYLILSWNRYMEEMSGYTKKEVVGKNFFDVFPEIRKERFFEQAQNIFANKKSKLKIENFLFSMGKNSLVDISMLIIEEAEPKMLVTLTEKENKDLEKRIQEAHFQALTAEKIMETKEREFLIIYEISEILRAYLPMEEKLHIILTAITAGDGLGYNRAGLFLVDDEEKTLVGKMGIGPFSGIEAKETWSGIMAEEKTVFDLVGTFRQGEVDKKQSFDSTIRSISLPLKRSFGVPVLSVFEKIATTASYIPGDRQVNEKLGKLIFGNQEAEFASVPMIVKGKVIGVIIADNIFTQKYISSDDLKMLMLFANQAAVALENSRLYGSVQQKMEDLAKANKELSEAHKCISRYDVLASLGKISAGVAHEIRNPLNSMVINMELLRQDLESLSPQLTEESLSLINIIQSEIERLEDLVKEFTSYARPSNVLAKEVNIIQIIEQVLRLIKYSEKRHNIKIHKNLSPNPAYILADKDQVKQAILNIILNAIQAMPSGGELYIETSYTECAEDRDTKMLCLKISDTGKGMNSSTLKRVFEPFFTSKSDGTGLGLSIVERIVSSHKGYMEVESQENQGSVFKIFLPLVKEGMDKLSHAASPS